MDGIKRMACDDELDQQMLINIHHAEGIDEPSRNPGIKRHYMVIFWIEPEEEYMTRGVVGLPDPFWGDEETFFMAVEGYNFNKPHFLYLQLMRFNSTSDPGTSSGVIEVGRVKIPLKKLLKKNGGQFGLVKLAEGETRTEGKIVINVDWRSIYPGDDY